MVADGTVWYSTSNSSGLRETCLCGQRCNEMYSGSLLFNCLLTVAKTVVGLCDLSQKSGKVE